MGGSSGVAWCLSKWEAPTRTPPPPPTPTHLGFSLLNMKCFMFTSREFGENLGIVCYCFVFCSFLKLSQNEWTSFLKCCSQPRQRSSTHPDRQQHVWIVSKFIKPVETLFLCSRLHDYLSRLMTKPKKKKKKMTWAPSEDSDQPGHPPSLIRVFTCAHWVAKDPSFLHADSEDSDQTGRMPNPPRLIWVFAGRTCHFVGFVMRRLICGYVKIINMPKTQGFFKNKSYVALRR